MSSGKISRFGCSNADSLTLIDLFATQAIVSLLTGNVASNQFGRVMSPAVADHFGLASIFFVFAIHRSGWRNDAVSASLLARP
jgi:hypothetical protein